MKSETSAINSTGTIFGPNTLNKIVEASKAQGGKYIDTSYYYTLDKSNYRIPTDFHKNDNSNPETDDFDETLPELIRIVSAADRNKIAANDTQYRRLIEILKFSKNEISPDDMELYLDNVSDTIALYDKVMIVKNKILDGTIKLTKEPVISDDHIEFSSEELPSFADYFSSYYALSGLDHMYSGQPSSVVYSLNDYFPTITKYYYWEKYDSENLKYINTYWDAAELYGKAISSIKTEDLITKFNTGIFKTLYHDVIENYSDNWDDFSTDRNPTTTEMLKKSFTSGENKLLLKTFRHHLHVCDNTSFNDGLESLCLELVLRYEKNCYDYQHGLKKDVDKSVDELDNQILSMSEFSIGNLNLSLPTAVSGTLTDITTEVKTDWNNLINGKEVLSTIWGMLSYKTTALKILFNNGYDYSRTVADANGAVKDAQNTLNNIFTVDYENLQILDTDIIATCKTIFHNLNVNGIQDYSDYERILFLGVLHNYLNACKKFPTYINGDIHKLLQNIILDGNAFQHDYINVIKKWEEIDKGKVYDFSTVKRALNITDEPKQETKEV